MPAAEGGALGTGLLISLASRGAYPWMQVRANSAEILKQRDSKIGVPHICVDLNRDADYSLQNLILRVVKGVHDIM